MKNSLIELQRNTPTRSTTGQEVDSWETYASVYASVKMLRGASYYAAEQTANETVMELFIHYRTDVSAADRVVLGGVTYEMASPPENIELRNRELLIRIRHVR